MNIGDRIKELRKELKINQKELGNLLNVTQQVISHYECSGSIDASKLSTISKRYNIDIRYFYEERPLSDFKTAVLRPNSTQGPDIPAGWHELLDDVSSLEQDKIRFIETVVRALLKEFSS
ncbi:helix-turn-helix domain-containing protein [Seleniivibrio woodruffii]|uniref:Transcriptional regulator with XRE-family HTH domain n=1 Tax=Seleniivibrio woodruffii TaxID=1078050 RepID=A0A4R1K2F5_9BACT|nr:helix-turn-helix transcriptional regulator [Seleniivibrio woodruffii]TCK58204.1 transcriptional regulator with XRE-family HTH domain [Seleniivibrio woodruffii]TVZ35669.1 transcriptional regulator with XRE-family HTH domain [Seleniivibrio woodruffii]